MSIICVQVGVLTNFYNLFEIPAHKMLSYNGIRKMSLKEVITRSMAQITCECQLVLGSIDDREELSSDRLDPGQ
jgi:hypothetical protein